MIHSMKVGLLFLAVLLVAAPSSAADVDGKWSGTFATPNGDITLAFEFKADGTTLTGTSTGPDGAQLPIKNGKIDGNKISFTVTAAFGDMSFDIGYTGLVSPAEIKMTLDFAGMPFEFVVKKAA
jgi:hypothetical protein